MFVLQSFYFHVEAKQSNFMTNLSFNNLQREVLLIEIRAEQLMNVGEAEDPHDQFSLFIRKSLLFRPQEECINTLNFQSNPTFNEADMIATGLVSLWVELS